MTKITGPYFFRKYWIEFSHLLDLTGERLKPTRMQNNEGQVPISVRDDDGGDGLAVLWVPRTVRIKRNAPYDTPDDDRDDFAERVVKALNAAEGFDK